LLNRLSLAALFLLAGNLTAQTSSPGTITGTVSNIATGANLEGAEVTLEPGNVSVLTARDGRFTLPQVAPGSYSLTVT
jgi:hypothetical protein